MGELRPLLEEVLPWLEHESRSWDEDAGEADNRRRQSNAADLVRRIQTSLSAREDDR